MKIRFKNWDYFYYLVTLTMYLLGVGIARYYGGDFKSLKTLIGVFWILCILISEKYMEFLFSPIGHIDEELIKVKDEKRRQFNLILLTFFLVSSAIAIILMMQISSFSIPIILIVVFTYILVASDYLQPVALMKNGFYELSISIFQFGLVPALGFFTAAEKYNPALLIFCFPVFLISLAHHLVLGLSTYAQDLTQKRRTLIININWQNGIFFHSFILIISYLLIFSSMWLGISTKLVFPALLTFPIAVFQIIWVIGISQGKRPQWPFIVTVSAATLISTAYLMTYSLWVN